MGWGGFAQVLLEGVAQATFGYWGLLVLLMAGVWMARVTVDAPLRTFLLALPLIWVVSLLSTAAFQVVPPQYIREMLAVPIVAPLLSLWAHCASILPDGGPRLPRVVWAVANLTFVVRATLFVGAYV